MSEAQSTPTRFIGLDIHKEYLVATGVNAVQEQIFGPHRVGMQDLTEWIIIVLRIVTFSRDTVPGWISISEWVVPDMLVYEQRRGMLRCCNRAHPGAYFLMAE